MKKRIEWIDLCKGIGILSMICGHIGLPYFADKYIHAWNMPIFFILSGYLYKQYKNKEIMLKKSKSLLIPYISFALILYVCSCIKNILVNDTDLVKQFIDIFTYNTMGDLPFGNSIWFLTCIFFVEVIFNFLKNFSKNEKILAGFILLICTAGYLLSIYNIRFIWGIDSALISIGFYYVGYMIKKLNKWNVIRKLNKVKLPNIIVIFIISTILIFVNGYVNIRTVKYSNIMLFYFNGIITSIMIIKVAKYFIYKNILKRIINAIIYIGSNSLIYLVFNQFFIYITKQFFYIFFNSKIIVCGISFITTLILLTISAKIINFRLSFLLGKFNCKENIKVI